MKYEDAIREFEEECREIADQCEEEGYLAHGSNYELRAEQLWDRFYKPYIDD